MQRRAEQVLKQFEAEKRARTELEAQTRLKQMIDREEYHRLVSSREDAERAAHRESEMKKELAALAFEVKDSGSQVEHLKRQMELAKSDKIELQAKLDLAG